MPEEQKVTNEETIAQIPEAVSAEPVIEKAPAEEDSEQRHTEEFVFPDEEKAANSKRFLRFREKYSEEDRDRLILSSINDKDLMEYLKLEQERLEFLQHAKDIREKRILSAFQLAVSLAAIVAITYFLKDNPTILVSILYIVGIIAALWIWKNPRDKQDK